MPDAPPPSLNNTYNRQLPSHPNLKNQAEKKHTHLINVSHIPAAPCCPLGSCTFHSTTIAPPALARVENNTPEISATPVDPVAPTWTTTCGEDGFEKAEPEPMIVGQASPTIWTPACVVGGEVRGGK